MTVRLLSCGSPPIDQPIFTSSKCSSTQVERNCVPLFSEAWVPDAVPQPIVYGDEEYYCMFTRASIIGSYLQGRLHLQLECVHLPAARRIRYLLVILEAAPLARLSAECAYDPLAAESAEVIAVGSATISATTEI